MKDIPADKPGAPVPVTNNTAPLTNSCGQQLFAETRKERPIDNPGPPRYVTTYTDPIIFQYRETIGRLQQEINHLRHEAAEKAKIPPHSPPDELLRAAALCRNQKRASY